MAGILSPFLGAGERYAHRPINKSFNLLKNENKKGKVEGVRKVHRKCILSGPELWSLFLRKGVAKQLLAVCGRNFLGSVSLVTWRDEWRPIHHNLEVAESALPESTPCPPFSQPLLGLLHYRNPWGKGFWQSVFGSSSYTLGMSLSHFKP